MPRLHTPIAVIGCTLALAACGSGGSQPAQTVTVTQTQPQIPAQAQPPTGSSASDSVTPAAIDSATPATDSPAGSTSAPSEAAGKMLGTIPGFDLKDDKGYTYKVSDIVFTATDPTTTTQDADPGKVWLRHGKLTVTGQIVNTTPGRTAPMPDLDITAYFPSSSPQSCAEESFDSTFAIARAGGVWCPAFFHSVMSSTGGLDGASTMRIDANGQAPVKLSTESVLPAAGPGAAQRSLVGAQVPEALAPQIVAQGFPKPMLLVVSLPKAPVPYGDAHYAGGTDVTVTTADPKTPVQKQVWQVFSTSGKF